MLMYAYVLFALAAPVGRLQLLAELRGHTDRVWCATWSPSGMRCATASTHQFIAGKLLATSSGDKSIRMWTKLNDLWTCIQSRCIHVVCMLTARSTAFGDEAHSRTIRSIAFSPDGKKLASCGFDGYYTYCGCHSASAAMFACLCATVPHRPSVPCFSLQHHGDLGEVR